MESLRRKFGVGYLNAFCRAGCFNRFLLVAGETATPLPNLGRSQAVIKTNDSSEQGTNIQELSIAIPGKEPFESW